MSSALDDYYTEVDNLTDNYKRLSQTRPDHEYLKLVNFDTDGAILVKNSFWTQFEPKDWKAEKGLIYKLHCLASANQKLDLI